MDRLEVQRPLFKWPRMNPIPADRRSYVPILLDRQGERQALEMTAPDVWERMTPLIQLELRRRGEAEPGPGSVRRAADRLAPALGGHAFYLDVMPARRNGLAASGRLLATAHAEFRRGGLHFIPVYTVGTRDQSAFVAAAVEQDQRGVALRYRALEPLNVGIAGVAEMLIGDLEALGVKAEDADLILDLRWLGPQYDLKAVDLADVINVASDAGEWRNVILAGTSMPDTLAGIPEDAVTPIERREWQLSRELDTEFGLRPVFGDYGVQHPRAPYTGRGGLLRANLRYTTTAAIFVARGIGEIPRMTPEQRTDQYRALCESIIETPAVFAGPDCCWGDRIIEDCASHRLEPGAQDMWRGVGTSHHLRVVAMDLADLDRRERPKPAPAPGVPTRRTAGRRRVGRVPTAERVRVREP